MNRRDTVLALLALSAASLAAEAQQAAKVYRIGFLTVGSESTQPAAVFAPFFDALREFGFIEGRNTIVERRFAAGNIDRLDEYAVEMVRLKVDLIVALATPAAQAAQRATNALPIVFLGVVDPVGAGLVRRLARPDGNLTGLSFLSTELSGKRVEMLKEVVPKLSRAAILWNPANASNALQLKETEAAARTIGVKPQRLEVRSAADIDSSLQAAVHGRAGAVIVLDDPLLAGTSEQARIAKLAAKFRLPTMSGFRGLAEAGGLIAYGTSFPDHLRRAAAYVDKILKGARPADLPVEQPTKFELVINLKTAKALGLTIPQSLLVRADEVIQ